VYKNTASEQTAVDRWIMQNSSVTVCVSLAVALSIALTILVAKLIGAALLPM
jgi:hypothetical protein